MRIAIVRRARAASKSRAHDEAADVAIATIREELEGRPLPDKVLLCAYDGAAKPILTRRMMNDG